MATTYKATFRPERRKYKETGELIEFNVPLLLDLSYLGRSWYNTGIRLQNIDDFDVRLQKLKSGKKAIENNTSISATNINTKLDNIRGHLSDAFNEAKALKKDITRKYLLEELKMRSGNVRITIAAEKTFLEEFILTYEKWHSKSIISQGRYKHYKVCAGMLDRFFKIKRLTKITVKEFTSEILLDFQSFLFEEHTYIDRYPDIYDELSNKQLPKERSQNTIASKLSMLRTFLNEQEELNKIDTNPFRRISKRDRAAMLRESYDEPIYLNIQELKLIINTPCPPNLERVRDCFLLHCALGARVDDYNALTWNNIIAKNNFLYVHYVPSKTSHNKSNIKPIDTPLVKFAYDVILKYKNKLPNKMLVPAYLGNISGKDGYNKQIKDLLLFYGINRSIIIRSYGEVKPIPINKKASSKLCRSTHIDIVNKGSLNKYISGLHEVGSKSVDRYTGLNIEEKYTLYRLAFQQDEYEL